MKKLLAILAICLLPGVAWGATWYAINSNDFCAVGAGNVSTIWCNVDGDAECDDGGSAFLDWDTGPATDDIFEANANLAITIAANPIDCAIDGSANATSVHLKTLQGGTFDTATSLTPITINANITAGTADCLAITGSANAVPVLTIVGNITGGTAGGIEGVTSSHTAGTVQITGDILGGPNNGSAHGLTFSGTSGSITITGNATAAYGNGLNVTSTGTAEISGNCVGSSTAGGYASFGCYATSAGAITVKGSMVPGTVCYMGAAGRIIWSPLLASNFIKIVGDGSPAHYYLTSNVAGGAHPARADVRLDTPYGWDGAAVYTGTMAAGGGAWAN